jgi:hypothetical protein
MAEKSDSCLPGLPLEEIVSRQQFELDRMREALALLGVNACSQCKRYFKRSDPGALFDAGEPVCYGCIRGWWPRRSAQLDAKDRENLEGKLVFWLRDHHHAELFKDPARFPEESEQELHIVANCLECRGTGTSLGDRCKYCEGRGTVWVIVFRKKG